MAKQDRKPTPEERDRLMNRAAKAIRKAGLDPDEIWSAKFCIEDILVQPSLSLEDLKAAVSAIKRDPGGSIYSLSKGLASGLMNDWETVATTAARNLAD